MKYYVRTFDIERHCWSPQKGVRVGPYTCFGLRKAIRKLQGMGYQLRDNYVLIEDEECYRFELQPDGTTPDTGAPRPEETQQTLFT